MGLSKTAWRVVGALVVVALAVIAVHLWRSEERSRLAAAEATQAGSRSGTGAAKAGGLSIDELIARGSQAPDVQAAIDRAKPYQTEVCGRGTVTVDPASDRNPPAISELLQRGGVLAGQMGTTMATDGSPARRAIGLRLLIASELDAADSPFSPTGCETEACKERRKRFVPPSLTRLVNLARDSENPLAYRQALVMCDRFRGPAPCDTLTWLRYTELAPDHLDGWLWLAQQRATQGDAAGAQVAMTRAAAARNSQAMLYDFRRGTAELPLMQSDGFDRAALTLLVYGVDAAEYFAPIGIVTSHCAAAAIRDPVRAAECEQLGRRLNESDAVLFVMIGHRIGERLARSPEAAKALERERLELGAALTKAGPEMSEQSQFSCDGTRRAAEHLSRIAQEGEAAFARRVLAEQRAKAGQAGTSPLATPGAAR
ncbi:hypothetical protein IP84_03675 [beta proteobacterium AAP99]|nr:hypothetical protein IP84_03675 [beta proteobacterium AAP99]